MKTILIDNTEYEIIDTFIGDGKHYDRERSLDMPKRLGTLLLQPVMDELDRAAYEYELARSEYQPSRQADNVITNPTPDPLRYFVQ